ncbi:Receptor-like protein kinase HSL1 [Apostasia shenzhenica]|uniref:non-specific serine/threonine protein kinase n=1 Tax=Apostasia shenzhenica TaxID=1088818 RepID=A0A2H9ZTJ6_9ASPA|nr:Receptor-like protein kinase HSL1 [Apostasia shenzhenica]
MNTHSPLPALLLLQLWVMAAALNQEGVLLLRAKGGFEIPGDSLADWKSGDPTPCNWTGVFCSSGAGGQPTVTKIDLSELNMAGPFPAEFCLLPSLSFLSLSFNYINSSLPNSSVLPCSSLTHLDLSQNVLVGALPSALSSLPLLRHLNLAGNNFTGAIPDSYSLFPSLQTLSLTANLLNDTIPPFLGNISTLRQLNLSYNPFAAGPLPRQLSNLTNLDTLWLAGCSLTGEIPPELGRLSKLTNFDVSSNFLTGEIPDALSALTSVVQIELYNNSLTGRFPAGLSNLTALRRIDASMNHLSGPIPDDIFSIPLLDSLHLYDNQFNGSVPTTAAMASHLFELRLFGNQLSGPLPASLGINSPLRFVDISYNQLTGEIPRAICGGGVLQELLLINNYISGGLPQDLTRCKTLTRVRLANNLLSGEVPAGIWGLPNLSTLELANNSLSGSIPADIAGAKNLIKLQISDNQFSGNIPAGIGSLSMLSELSASGNRLTGRLPESLRVLGELVLLLLHKNFLSGELLTGIQQWKNLTQLNLANNEFTGLIPSELGDLRALVFLDLSGNQLVGEIPIQLQNLQPSQLNLSDNQLSGSIPPLFMNRAYQNSFLGNPSLCRDPTGNCLSSINGARRGRSKFFWLLRSILILFAVVLIVGLSFHRYKKRKTDMAKSGLNNSDWILMTSHKLGFSECDISRCLQEDNVIGSGASGKVYKVVLGNDEVVAVKKLWNSPDMDAVAALGKIRHKNIVNLWSCCVERDSKLLVYEFMVNGSLRDVLRGGKAGALCWGLRLRIAMDAAEGLCYLHHGCHPPIVHGNFNSNNILLDADFGAKVADSGVAMVVDGVEKSPAFMSVDAASGAYHPPEYSCTRRFNEKNDVHSFGVVILELITGKLAADTEFGENDLVNWVCSGIQQNGVKEVIDSRLDLCNKEEEITKFLSIGLLCSSFLPMSRPPMMKVVKMLARLMEHS